MMDIQRARVAYAYYLEGAHRNVIIVQAKIIPATIWENYIMVFYYIHWSHN